MKLAEVLSIFPQIQWGKSLHLAESSVSQIVIDSRAMKPGSVFVAIKGEKADGHDYLAQIAGQASAIILQDASKLPQGYTGVSVVVSNTRDILSKLAAKFYGAPAKNLFSVAVTGTNGKTTTTYITECLLNGFGFATGVIGTIDHHLQTRVWNTSLTTPDAISFQCRLAEFLALGARAVAFEASSHALDQHRVDSSDINVGIFTNLTRDHLDYHQTMENYFLAKVRLFQELMHQSSKTAKRSVINGDDPYGVRLLKEFPAPSWSYGQTERADLRFEIKEIDFTGSKFFLKTPSGMHEFSMPMIGIHNVYNAVGAIGAGLVAGASLSTLAQSLAGFAGVPGRMQVVPNKNGLRIFVDYAHTDDGIKTALTQLAHLRSATKSKARFITVFGCGGDRDRGKRPLMLAAARSLSDEVIVTSDNPRSEDPQKIIEDIIVQVPENEIGKNIVIEVDRRLAIGKAISRAKKEDVILIAGKGHEKFQQIGTQKIPFDDWSIAKEFADGI